MPPARIAPSSSKGKSKGAFPSHGRLARKPLAPVELNPLSYDRTDPFTALNAMRTVLAALPTRQLRLTVEEHALVMRLLAIVEPFVGPAPARRALTRLPTEILDAVAFCVDDKRDLLALALTCRRMYSVVFPRHYDYRIVKCKVSSLRVWNHLIVRRGLARNVRQLEVLDERSTVPETIPCDIETSDTDLESSDDELEMHAKQERYLAAALARMTALVSFTWSCSHLPISVESLWPILMKCQTLQQVTVKDNLVFSPDNDDESSAARKKRQVVFPALRAVSMQTTKHTYALNKNPDMSRISTMLANCPVLESLKIDYTSRRSPGFSSPILDDFLLCGRWPNLRTLALTNLRCSPQAGFDATMGFLLAHPQLEVLHLDVAFGAGSPYVFPPGCIPRLRELRCGRDLAGALLACPGGLDGRPLDVIGGMRLSGSMRDTSFLYALKQYGTSVRRIELAGWTDMDDIRQLAESAPQLTWLDVGRRTTSAHAAKPASATTTNVAEWAAILAQLPQLTTFHGVRFFYEVAQGSGATASVPLTLSERSRMRRNDEIASLLAWKCTKLRRLDHWEEGSGRVVVLLRDGEKVRYEVRRVKT